MKTLEVRRLCVKEARAFVVIDTAIEENPGHASIYAATPEKGEAHVRRLRHLLIPLLQERMSLEEAYAGTVA